MNGYYKQLTDLLRAHGFRYSRQGKGSHEIWVRHSVQLTVPFNCQSRHTANAVLKAAGIDHKF
jgi:predicted RNA binding protein YcfA (HicA-like mRNA interferase family)